MPDQQESRLGHAVCEYRLVRKLGGGGFGTVYLAEHVHKHTQVAVKVLDMRLTRPEDFKDFLNEVRTVLLRHPHIVPLLDFGISRDNLPFLVMEYADRGTLRGRHPRGERVPVLTVVSYVDQIASALQYAHDQRVIHRDVKPENILVRADGTLLVSDFGIAKFLEQSVLMSVQTQVGTPVYMAPEQHLGYPCFASDQYALAVVIYEWICGVRPFQGTALGLTVQHMNTPPPRLRDYLPEVPEAVERVILKALAKAPEDRFERIQEMASALRRAVQPSPSMGTLSPTRATQTADVPVFHQKSPPAPHPSPPKTLKNVAFPFPQTHRLSRRFSLLMGGTLVLLLLTVLLATPKLIIPPSPPKADRQVIVDNLNDWSKTYSHTTNLTFDTNHSQWMLGDTSLLARTANTAEEVVWKLPGMTSFQAITYFWPSQSASPLSDLSVYTSADDVQWTVMKPTLSGGTGNWIEYTYTLSHLSKVNFVQMRWSVTTNYSWAQQIGQVTLTRY